jgi:cytosine/uracil/thiamine/allantoin permease
MAVAQAAVNNFRTVTKIVGLTTDIIYEAPVGFVGVILLAQCANVGSSVENISVFHNRIVSGIGTITTEVVKNFVMAPNDTVNLLPGKLVLETGDYISISGSSETNLKFIGSILETFNQ